MPRSRGIQFFLMQIFYNCQINKYMNEWFLPFESKAGFMCFDSEERSTWLFHQCCIVFVLQSRLAAMISHSSISRVTEEKQLSPSAGGMYSTAPQNCHTLLQILRLSSDMVNCLFMGASVSRYVQPQSCCFRKQPCGRETHLEGKLGAHAFTLG